MDEIWDHEWDDWVEDGYPMVGPAFDWAGIRYITIHYPGSPRVLVLTFDAERGEIRAEQRMYTDDPDRGYSLGYNAKVFQDGSKWKLRGDVLRCAANGSQATNVPGFAIQIRVANDEAPTQALIDSVRELVAWCREKAGRHLPINGHRDLKPTACPGDKAYALIQAGVFEPIEAPVVIDPPPVTPPGGDDMAMTLFKPVDADAWFYGQADAKGIAHTVEWTGDGSRPEVQQRLAEEVAAGIEVNDRLSIGSFRNCVHLGDLPPDGADLKHAWRDADFARVIR